MIGHHRGRATSVPRQLLGSTSMVKRQLGHVPSTTSYCWICLVSRRRSSGVIPDPTAEPATLARSHRLRYSRQFDNRVHTSGKSDPCGGLVTWGHRSGRDNERLGFKCAKQEKYGENIKTSVSMFSRHRSLPSHRRLGSAHRFGLTSAARSAGNTNNKRYQEQRI